MLYSFYYNGRIIITNGFIKKTMKTPKKEIELAKKYRKNYLERVGNMKTLEKFKAEQMNDDEFRKEYDSIQPELDIIRAIVDARISQNMTQKQLAEVTGINQADISKLENGTRNPSIALLKRLAEGLGMTLKIEFIPKQKI